MMKTERPGGGGSPEAMHLLDELKPWSERVTVAYMASKLFNRTEHLVPCM